LNLFFKFKTQSNLFVNSLKKKRICVVLFVLKEEKSKTYD
jgi:hypothetical protein